MGQEKTLAELMQADWLVVVIALVIAVLLAWWIFFRSRRTRVESAPEDEALGAGPARRNQAFIDATPAALGRQQAPEAAARDFERAERIMPAAMPQGLASGEAIEAAALREPAEEPPATHELPPSDPLPLDEPAGRAAQDIEPEPVAAYEPAFAVAPTVEVELASAEPSSAPATSVSVSAAGDDLTRIKGLGPRIAAQLGELGVTTLAQIAAWDEAEINRIDARLGRFQGRIRRDQWPEQARLLAAGDTAGYEERFGKL